MGTRSGCIKKASRRDTGQSKGAAGGRARNGGKEAQNCLPPRRVGGGRRRMDRWMDGGWSGCPFWGTGRSVVRLGLGLGALVVGLLLGRARRRGGGRDIAQDAAQERLGRAELGAGGLLGDGEALGLLAAGLARLVLLAEAVLEALALGGIGEVEPARQAALVRDLLVVDGERGPLLGLERAEVLDLVVDPEAREPAAVALVPGDAAVLGRDCGLARGLGRGWRQRGKRRLRGQHHVGSGCRGGSRRSALLVLVLLPGAVALVREGMARGLEELVLGRHGGQARRRGRALKDIARALRSDAEQVLARAVAAVAAAREASSLAAGAGHGEALIRLQVRGARGQGWGGEGGRGSIGAMRADDDGRAGRGRGGGLAQVLHKHADRERGLGRDGAREERRGVGLRGGGAAGGAEGGERGSEAAGEWTGPAG
mmetsp:Transcript_20786/g.66311  ORF Transcript_20786/g.66311 Transcript_20786/m.66311 type:complete len:427 (-) Transcript_20786:871-2151(-)